MKRLLTFSIMFSAVIACHGADRAAQVDDIREATFRYQFAKNASGQQQNAQVYFLSVVPDGKEKSEDPTDEFMKRFVGHKPRVAKDSESRSSMEDGVRDQKTGERGLSFHVGAIRWKSDTEVEVDGGYYEAGLSASGNTYYLKKKRKKWIVERDVMHWISQRMPIQRPEPMAVLRTAMAHH